MMSNSIGIRRSLPVGRRLVNDLLRYADHTPLVPIERVCHLGELATLRSAVSPKVSWATVFIKAYGLLAQRNAHLRQTLMTWPWSHLYEHSHSVAMLAVSRATADEEQLFWGRFVMPETRTLVDLQRELDQYKSGPVESAFRRQVRLAKFPSPLRRIAWWLTLNSGPKKAKRLGTFGLSTVGGLGAYNRQHPSCLSTSLSYGPIEPAGKMLVTILFDHRIVDGAAIARDLAELEEILVGVIADELRGMADQSAPAHASGRAA